MNILAQWQRLSRLPGGAQIFSFFVGKFAPYSGSIGAVIRELGPGHAVVELKDRRKVRNHLDCIHAVALMNLAELSSGIAMMAGLPPGMRGILVGLQIEYFKKSRGTLRSSVDCTVPTTRETINFEIPVEVKNAEGEVVCKAVAKWRLGPEKTK